VQPLATVRVQASDRRHVDRRALDPDRLRQRVELDPTGKLIDPRTPGIEPAALLLRALSDVDAARQHLMFAPKHRVELAKALAGLDVTYPPFVV